MIRSGICSIMAVLSLFSVANAAPVVTDPTLDTANDLMDTGGGTVFACDSVGGTSAPSGGGPWAVNSGPKLYDNDVETTASTKSHDSLTPPFLVGVYGMTAAKALGGFAITTDDDTFAWWQANTFTIQGSNDSTDGYGGTWTDIFVFDADDLPVGDRYNNNPNRLLVDKTYRWNADDNINTFLSSGTFTAFRLKASFENISFAEIEFFAVPPPAGSVFRFF